MKPLFSAFTAWSCIVISAFAIVILSALGTLFKSGHESMMGSTNDPKDGKSVAATIFGAVIVYIGFLVFCSGQAWLHSRQRSSIQLS
ncbi:uncharacterized protein LAJ45_07872 [Morchella importuna]|uniref:Uncharacterized protein n=1 Tax=Morchella conica CCBAS932 TaxID=1392247 RepID=A0A3N4KLQ3_9PEZI|nr:uncharacterized protein H6S33_012588 [Morchella sextelata]XP_045969412.1 uncharacterized protein LAJ45_07872 [Morchella importuna]KAI5849352.1 hypothetical protein DFP73DRAFT_540300 [Morchella snyderi]RPB11450.1 hypothetical protein P167DRAFT_606367 [Morchella conica CCBAS932]KAH0610042.1 hypothetical protein H6S33_012588 [Morchella sextelata]KAH8148108.1 hypothetical protein LAJ45_07872 [Morchella importuna]